MGEAIGAVTERSRGILLGRTTYEMFEPAWSTRTVEEDPGAPFFNDTTKYVVSGTLTAPTWRNSRIIGAYDPDVIRSLKSEVDGDLYVSGSGTLVRAMLCGRPRRRAASVRLPAHSWDRDRGSSPRKPRPASCRLRRLSRTTTASSIWPTDPRRQMRSRRRAPNIPPTPNATPSAQATTASPVGLESS